jgi:hypothetical protein
MKVSFALATTMVALTVVPTLCAASSRDTSPHHIRYTHHPVPKRPRNEVVGPSMTSEPSALSLSPAPKTTVKLRVAPYPPGQGDADGLSRNPEDCNKGCIGLP